MGRLELILQPASLCGFPDDVFWATDCGPKEWVFLGDVSAEQTGSVICIAYDAASIGLLLGLYADEVVDGGRGWEGGRGLYVDLVVATPASVVVHSSHNCSSAQMKAVHS